MKNLITALRSKPLASLVIASIGLVCTLQAQAQVLAHAQVSSSLNTLPVLTVAAAAPLNFAWVRADGKTTANLDNQALHSVKAANQGEYFWFNYQGKDYLLRDQATLERLAQIWQNVEQLNKQAAGQGADSDKQNSKNAAEVNEQIEKLAKTIESKNKKVDRLNYKLNTAIESEKESLNGQLRELNASLQSLNLEMAKLKANLTASSAPDANKNATELAKQIEQASQHAHSATRALIQESLASGSAKLAAK